jgi:hypothetical protein
MLYAAIGLIASFVVHALTFFGVTLGGNPLFVTLHVAIFPLWFIVVTIAMKTMAGMSRKDSWKAALSGCPAWMRYMTNGFFIYALVNFLIFFLTSMANAPHGVKLDTPSPEIWRGFSGHWMAFYSAGLAIATTAYRRGTDNWGAQCPNGHAVAVSDNYCPVCGGRLDKTKMSLG